MFVPCNPGSAENRIVRRHSEKPNPRSAERSDELPEGADASEGETTKEQAELCLERAEQDSSEARARIDRAKKVMEIDGESKSQERRDVLEQKIDALNERNEKLRASLPVEFLKQTTRGQIIDTHRFGISEDGRTYQAATFNHYRQTVAACRLHKDFKVIHEDRDGKVYAFDEAQDRGANGKLERETREDSIRLYQPIDVLENRMSYYETAYSMDKIKEDPKYRGLFNEQKRVRSVKGKFSETFIDVASPEQDFAEISSKAKQFQGNLKQLLDRIPEVSKQTAILRLISGSEVVVGRDGKMRMAFSAEHAPEFRALADKLFKGLAGHVETDDEGRYAVEVAPESTAKLLARLEIVFLHPTQHVEDYSIYKHLQKQIEIIESGVEIETPSVMNEHAQSLNARLKPYTAKRDIYSDDAPAGKFLSGMQFDADDAGQLTFSHKSTDAVFRYFQQIDDSDMFESSDDTFKGIRLKMKDGSFQSNDLPLDRATELIEKLQQKIRSTDTKVESTKPDQVD